MFSFARAIVATVAAVALLGCSAGPDASSNSATKADASAAALKIGDPAPALDVGRWVQGEPVRALETGRIYVLEFWATWCGPCIKTIPHVTALSKRHPEVTFIGVNVMEPDESAVAPFVKQMGQAMTYRVVLDNKSTHEKGAMETTWKQAAKQPGIPCAFIVDRERRVAWIGHPNAMDEPLAKIVAGTYDISAAAAEAAEDARLQSALDEKVAPKSQAKKYDEALAGLDEVAKAFPARQADLSRMRLGLLLRAGRTDEAYAAMDAFAAARDADADDLNDLARVVLTFPLLEGKRDIARAARWAGRAVELTQGTKPGPLSTLARAHAAAGRFDQAAATQQRAIGLAEGELRLAMEKSLDAYRRSAMPAAQ